MLEKNYCTTLNCNYRWQIITTLLMILFPELKFHSKRSLSEHKLFSPILFLNSNCYWLELNKISQKLFLKRFKNCCHPRSMSSSQFSNCVLSLVIFQCGLGGTHSIR
jgi:hypothetical protein